MSHSISPATDVRRFGYYVPKYDGTIDFVMHCQVASDEVIVELNKVVDVIFKLQPIVFAFDIVERNYCELINSFETYLTSLHDASKQNIIPIHKSMEGMVLASQRISNFLSSTSAFLSQTEKQVSCIHGKNSNELSLWNHKRRDFHASYFSYRFLYELRNFVQHRSLPVSNFNISGERSSGDMIYKAVALVVRDELLNSGYDWGKIRKEIVSMQKNIDLFPVINDYFSCLRQLLLMALQFQLSKLIECGQYFDVVNKIIQIPGNAVPILFVGETASQECPPSNYEVIPMKHFEHIVQTYNKHSGCNKISMIPIFSWVLKYQ